MSIEMKTAEYDGKKIAYHSGTEFLIQVGSGKGSYKTKAKVTGDFDQAISQYNSINVESGHKKRLLVPSFNAPTVARHLS